MVERKYSHPVLKKVIKVRKNYNAHDENNKFKKGDKVSIQRVNRFLKIKNFKLWRKIRNDRCTNRITSCRQYWS